MPELPRMRMLTQWGLRHGWLVAIAVAYLYAFPYFPRIHSANELPRVYLVKAICDDGTFAIDKGVQRWGSTADVSPSDGHQYSNKAPGSSFLVVPVYALVSWIGGEPSLATSMWLCRVVGGVIPALLFLWLLWGFLARYTPEPAVRRLVVLAYALGSLAMTYSMLYYSHQLAAICIASSWILAVDVVEKKRSMRWMAAVGFFAGAALLVDYQAAFAGVPIAVYLIVKLWAWPKRDLATALAIAAAAAAVPVAALLWYHKVCFGSPWRTGYDATQTFAYLHKQGFLGISKLRKEAFWGSFFAPDNGLFVLSPWLLFALPGAVLLWRRGDRATTLVCSAVAIIFILFISSISFWRGGWGVGPRYVTAMLPFWLPLVVVAIDALRSRPLVLGALCGTIVSAVIIYCASAWTFPYWPDSVRNPLYEVTLRMLTDNAVAPNVASAIGIQGLLGLVPLMAGIAALVGWALYRVVGWRGLAAAIVVGIAIVTVFRLAPINLYGQAAYLNTVYPAVTR
ncbi:MAG TPA: hypothetical protein VFV99_24560 [Kofleriaceae bacterium]|nr:hypothetical protein [Kofleriaceae bacterium]